VLHIHGGIITITGSVSAITGIGLLSLNKEGVAYHGFFMTIIGLGVTVVGLPILITGSSRVKRINGIRNTVSDRIFFEIAPCSFQNYMAQNYQHGVTLRIRF